MDELQSEFKIVSKKAEYYLGLEVEQKHNSLKISQQQYAKEIAGCFNFTGYKPVSTPIFKCPEIVQPGKADIEKEHNFPYRQAVGALVYLMLGSRPDLPYSIGFVSRSFQNPSLGDIYQVKRVPRYITDTIDFGIVYQGGKRSGTLDCFSDADFGKCTRTARSTSQVVVKHVGGAISWLSQRQAMVATSTTEAKIVAANEVAKKII